MNDTKLICDGCNSDVERLLFRNPKLLCIDCVEGRTKPKKFTLPPLKGKR